MEYLGTQLSVPTLLTKGLLTAQGGQISFPATQIPSSNANTLDDYEEGTWTPVLTFQGVGDLSVTYSIQLGFYTKIGREVIARFTLNASSITYTTSTGDLRVTGLPFTSSSTTGSTTRSAVDFTGINKTGGYSNVTAGVNPNTSFMFFPSSGMGLSAANVRVADVASGNNVFINATVIFMV